MLHVTALTASSPRTLPPVQSPPASACLSLSWLIQSPGDVGAPFYPACSPAVTESAAPVDLAVKVTPLPEKVTPLPEKVTPLPEEVTPLPEELTPLPEEVTSLPGKVTPLPGRQGLLAHPLRREHMLH